MFPFEDKILMKTCGSMKNFLPQNCDAKRIFWQTGKQQTRGTLNNLLLTTSLT